MARAAKKDVKVQDSPKTNLELLQSVKFIKKNPIIEGKEVDQLIYYSKERNGSTETARKPFQYSRFMREPLLALRQNPKWQHGFTNATDEQMQLITSISYTELVAIQKKLNNASKEV